MNDLSQRRRLAGRGLLAAALVALPLTASISYAEPTAPAAPVAPVAPVAPAAPEAPLAPLALQAVADAEAPDVEHDKHVFVWKDEDSETGGDGEVRKVHRYKVIRDGEELSAEEREELMKELREDMAELRIDLKESMKEHRLAMLELKNLDGDMQHFSVECKDNESAEATDPKGRRVIKICKSHIMASAIAGLESARAQIAHNKDMTDEIREEVLRELDREIARIKEESKD